MPREQVYGQPQMPGDLCDRDTETTTTTTWTTTTFSSRTKYSPSQSAIIAGLRDVVLDGLHLIQELV